MAQSRRSPQRGTGGGARRWLAGLVLVLAAAGTGAAGTAASLITTGGPAGAQPIGNCSTSSGVVVVVDFAHWGGTVERGCAADPSAGSTTGLRALHTAGFSTAGVSGYGTAFICRIDTQPTPTQTSCVKTPPASAYWSYWHADAGQTTWSYSNAGVATYRPPPGSVTTWVFGGTSVTGSSGTGRPPFTPTQVRATNVAPAGGGSGATTTTTALPATTTTTTPAGSSGPAPPGGAGAASQPGGGQSSGGSPSPGSGGAGTSAPGGGSGGSPAPSTTTTTAPPAGDRGTGPTTTTRPGTGGGGASSGRKDRSGGGSGGGGSDGSGGSRDGRRAGAGPRIVDVDPASARRKPPPGSPLPLVLGIVAVVALAAAGGVIAWRRRRAGEGAGG